MKPLSKAAGSNRVAKSYTIEAEIDRYVVATKGDHSASERVNDLIKRGIAQEQQQELEREAAMFYAIEAHHRTATKAFQKAARRTLERD
jgi:hypothetical protein